MRPITNLGSLRWRKRIHSKDLDYGGFRFWHFNFELTAGYRYTMQEIEHAEKAVAARIKELQKLLDRMARARRQAESGKQAVSALTTLGSELRGIELSWGPFPDLDALATQVTDEARKRCEQGERIFIEELRRVCETSSITLGKVGGALTVGPFSLQVNWPKGVASIEFGKAEVEGALSLVPKELLARVKELSAMLLTPPGTGSLPALAKDFEEGIRVCVARRGGSLMGELRAELPALYREMVLIRHGDGHRAGARAVHYPMARFVVEVKTLVQSDHNTTRRRRFRLETAVIENTRNPKKSIFVPSDLTKGFGEGTYFQAMILTGSA